MLPLSSSNAEDFRALFAEGQRFRVAEFPRGVIKTAHTFTIIAIRILYASISLTYHGVIDPEERQLTRFVE